MTADTVTATEHDDLRTQIADLQRERQDSRDHRTRVQTLRLVRCERPHLARGLR